MLLMMLGFLKKDGADVSQNELAKFLSFDVTMTSKEDIAKQMCDEFWEVGASGNVYSKQDVIETLLERYNNPDYQDIWEAKDFELTKIAPDNYLLTYVLIQDKTRVTRRAPLWRKKNGDWKILYHQGTIIYRGKE